VFLFLKYWNKCAVSKIETATNVMICLCNSFENLDFAQDQGMDENRPAGVPTVS
jgi:hypothetical protein